MKISVKLYFALTIYLSANITFAQVAKVVDTPGGTVISTIGGNGIPHSTSILDIRSTNKGVLFPRMTTANRDAITVPQAGLLVYNTSTNQFNYHNGSSWQQASFGNQWGVNGSILHHSGQVAIGTSASTNPYSFLTVRGNLGGSNFEGMYIDGSNNNTKPFYGYAINSIPKAYHYYDGSNSKWHLFIDDGERLTVTSAGLVGIGTTTPNHRLTVNGSAQINTNLYVNGSIDVDYNATIKGYAIVQGNTSIGGNADIDETLTVNNNK